MDCDLYYFSFHLAFEDLKHLTCSLVANSFSPDDFLYHEFLAANYYRSRRFASLVALIKSKLEPRFFFLFFHILTQSPVIANAGDSFASLGTSLSNLIVWRHFMGLLRHYVPRNDKGNVPRNDSVSPFPIPLFSISISVQQYNSIKL